MPRCQVNPYAELEYEQFDMPLMHEDLREEL